MLATARQQSPIFIGGAIILLLSVLGAILTENWILLGIPFIALLAVFVTMKPRSIYYMLIGLLPFSTEVNLPGGFGTDLPTEPLMILTCGILFLLANNHLLKWDSRYLINTVSVTLMAVLVWTMITTIFSTEPMISVKYLLAKLWYIIPFYYGTIILFHQDHKIIRGMIKLLTITVVLATIYVVLRHGMMGFDFMKVNRAGRPIFRNHVNYGAILVLTLPFLWYLYQTSVRSMKRLTYGLVLCLMLFAIYTTYTRAAYVCVIGILAGYFMIRNRMTSIGLIIALLVTLGGLTYLMESNTYLELAPDYQNTISHHNIDNLMEATIKGEDVSTMERVYRWVAGVRMVGDRPLLGFGPGAFYDSYLPYTISSFETYVSNNPEKSGIHCYYLMTACEQGIIGLILFLILTVVPLLLAEKVFAIAKCQEVKYLAMASALSLISIDLLLLINDLLEADKVGPYYFLSIGLITICSVHTKVYNKPT